MARTLVELDGSLKHEYQSSRDDVPSSLYAPCLSKSEKYYRGTGYFRSSVFSIISDDLVDFCRSGGKMHLLTSTDIDPEDFDAAIEGYGLREFQFTIDEMLAMEHSSRPTRLLCALVAAGMLEIHVAKLPKGIYHDKAGFFEDKEGNTVAFCGSGNETRPGVSKQGNAERYIVNWDWNEKGTWADFGEEWKRDLVDAIDNHQYDGAEVMSLTEIDPRILKKHNVSLDLDHYSQNEEDEGRLFNYSELHRDGPKEHQLDAIDIWINNGHRASFEHATGTYKTATGLLAAEHSLKMGVKAVVISTPRIIISQNWLKLLEKCYDSSVKVIPCWSEYPGWQERAHEVVNSSRQAILVFVNDSLWGSKGRSVCRSMKDNWALIADEAHNWEEDHADERGKLAADFMTGFSPTHRLALSALIADPNNPSPAESLIDFFTNGDQGRITDLLDLREAIRRGFLRNYHYELKTVEVPQEAIGKSPSESASDIWRTFQNLKKSLAPGDSVKLLLDGNRRVLTYTGNTIATADSTMRDIQREWNITSVLPMKFRKVTSEESQADRTRIIEEFNYGRTRGLVAIKVLDEGVDLPVADAAVIATSTSDHRQWIQRRGRILRKREIEDDTVARIVDYILDISEFTVEVKQILLEKGGQDLERIREFALSALPGTEAEIESLLINGGWS